MKVCAICKIKADDSKNFCRQCGAKLLPERAVAPEVLAKRQSFETRISQEPDSASLLAEYGEFLASIPLPDEALDQFHKAVQLEPTHEGIRRGLIQVYQSQQD